MEQKDKTHLIYIFRDKLEVEIVPWYEASTRKRILYNCTQANIYRVDPDGTICEYFGNYWRIAKNVPERIKLAAMLL